LSIIIISILTVIAFLFFLNQGKKLIISMLAALAFLFFLNQGNKLIISMLAAIAVRFFLNQGKGVVASMKSDQTTGASGGHFTNNDQAIKVTAGNTIFNYSDGWGT
jgi:hypothetical protein